MKAALILSHNSLTLNTYTDLSEMITQLNNLILDAKKINNDSIFRFENVEYTQLYEWLIYRFDEDKPVDLPNLGNDKWETLAKILSVQEIEDVDNLSAEIGFDSTHLAIVPTGNYVYNKANWFDLHRSHFQANSDDMSYFEYSKNKHSDRKDIIFANDEIDIKGVIKRGEKYHLFFPFLDYQQEIHKNTDFKLTNKEQLGKEIAKLNFYAKDSNTEGENKGKNKKRHIYKAGEGKNALYLSLDMEQKVTVAFEVCDEKGNHKGEYDAKTGSRNKEPNSSHNINVK
jgi:hypothetical protein